MGLFSFMMLCIAVITLSVFLFGGWLFVSFVRFVLRAFTAERSAWQAVDSTAADGRLCPRHKCRAKNPGDARFCRRCGQELAGAEQVQTRRAAMW